MQIVIKISEDSYKATCRGLMLPPDVENVVNAIRNGTPLPKGYGRLIDTTNLIEEVKARCDNPAQVIEVINDEMAIIEADKENKEWTL